MLLQITMTLSLSGGGGNSHCLSSYVTFDPASTVYPKQYQECQAPQNIFELLVTPKSIPISDLDLKKGPKDQ